MTDLDFAGRTELLRQWCEGLFKTYDPEIARGAIRRYRENLEELSETDEAILEEFLKEV